MMYGIAFASLGAHSSRGPPSAASALAAAPSRTRRSTSTQSTITYAITQTATSSSTEERFQYGTHGSQYAFQ